MPAQAAKSPFDFKKALKTHAADPTDYGQDFESLPGGISGGVARLTTLTTGVYKTGDNKGKRFFRAAGVVISPKTHVEVIRTWEDLGQGKGRVKNAGTREVVCEGKQTSIMVPLCDLPAKSDGTVRDTDYQIGVMMNELRKLGGDECTAHLAEAADPEAELEALFQSLVSADPPIYFKFGTRSSDPTAQYPDPRVWESWYGSRGMEGYVPDQAPAVRDASPPPSRNGHAPAQQAQPSTPAARQTPPAQRPAAAAPARPAAPARKPAPPPVQEPEETEDLYALAERADDNDTEAQRRLEDLAREAGADAAAIKAAENWRAVADLASGTTPDAAAEDQPEEAPAEDEAPANDDPWADNPPKKEDIYAYTVRDAKGQPIKDKKTGKAARPVEAEVTAVNAKARTVDLKDLADAKKTYKGVPWDALEESQ